MSDRCFFCADPEAPGFIQLIVELNPAALVALERPCCETCAVLFNEREAHKLAVRAERVLVRAVPSGLVAPDAMLPRRLRMIEMAEDCIRGMMKLEPMQANG